MESDRTMTEIKLHSIERDLLDGYAVRVQTPNYDSERPRRSISAGTFNARSGAESTVGIMLTVSDADDLRAIADVLIEAAARIGYPVLWRAT